MSDLTTQLLDALAAQGADPQTVASAIQTGRSGSGNLRNFKAMGDDKLVREADKIIAENNDPEAIEAVRAVMGERGL